MSSGAVRIGVVGCGDISSIYFGNIKRFDGIEVVACADLDPGRAQARAIEFDVPKFITTEDLLADDSVEIVLNLTVPKVHGRIAHAAVAAGKSVYNEKPLCVELAEAQLLLRLAKENGVYVGCAPDTFLGGGLQAARRALDNGAIGRPVAGTAFMMSHGTESWHPNPEFFYQDGGGPMLDMGPYYLTSLVSMLGPVRRLTGMARKSFLERTITTEARHGERIPVEVSTHVAGVLEFNCGAVVTLVTSFDVWHAQVPFIEIYGTEGTLSLPDPNTFDGPVRIRSAQDDTWRDFEVVGPYQEDSRGLGLAELAHAIRAGRQPRANGAQALHVLEVMHAIEDASQSGRQVEIGSTCDRSEVMPTGLPFGVFDDQHPFC